MKHCHAIKCRHLFTWTFLDSRPLGRELGRRLLYAAFRNKVFFLSNYILCSVAFESNEEHSSALLTQAAHALVLRRPSSIPFGKGICWILGSAWGPVSI